MLKSEINDPVWFFDLEWVPDAAGAIRLYGLPQDTSERDAMQRLWEGTKGYDPAACPRPFVKYALSRVVSIASLAVWRASSAICEGVLVVVFMRISFPGR